jgi:putative ABC transport system permease protein
MPSRFSIRFTLSALRYRRQRLLLAFGALAVASALATVMFGIYDSVANRLHNEFGSYGANLVAVAVNGGTIPLSMVDSAKRAGAAAHPILIAQGRVNGRIVAVAGVDNAKPIAKGRCLAGETVAAQLNIRAGASIPLENNPCTLAGIISTGGPEDNELMVDFDSAARLAGTHDEASMIEIQAPGDRIENVRAGLAKEFPMADVRTVQAVADTESNVVLKMRAALLLLTLLILAITTLCVSSNFTEIVIDRAKEIGIMKALGGAERRIAAFFISESATLAVVATIVGYLGGVFAVAGIGREIFGGVFRLHFDWLVLAGVGVVMLIVATVATTIATARIWNIQPAVILRGE